MDTLGNNLGDARGDRTELEVAINAETSKGNSITNDLLREDNAKKTQMKHHSALVDFWQHWFWRTNNMVVSDHASVVRCAEIGPNHTRERVRGQA